MDAPDTLLHAPNAREYPTTGLPLRRKILHRGQGPSREELVLGRYRLLAQLGSGGFGVVWRAHDELLHREVAVKRVWLGVGGGPIDGERASREALAAARLAHPAIVALYEACAQDGAFYLISELVDGDTLARLIADDALEDEEVLEIGVALASALIHAHERGVIHRDIKPQNVLVPYHRDGATGTPQQSLVVAAKLTDFGGASLVGEEALTRTGDVLGTLAYMAPEQSEGREAGVAADLYSLALVIYESLCGVNPVRAGTPAATVRRIGRRLPPLQSARRDLTHDLTRAIDRALAPTPGDRGRLEELRDAFECTLEQELQHPRRRRAHSRKRASNPPTPRIPAAAPQRALEPRRALAPAEGLLASLAPEPDPRQPHPVRPTRLPRTTWLACAALAAGWQLATGRPGVGLLLVVALLPLFVLSGRHGACRLGPRWLVAALAPVLGLVGLAGAFPAIAGQALRWRERAALGALGYWWLRLAEPLLDSGTAGRRLWLGPPAGMPSRAAWEGSLSLTATHVIGPLLAVGVLLGALLWGAGAVALAWIVRGRNAAVDIVAVSMWSAGLAAAAPVLDAGLKAHARDPSPRGAALGAVLGGVLAVAARALRGPV